VGRNDKIARHRRDPTADRDRLSCEGVNFRGTFEKSLQKEREVLEQGAAPLPTAPISGDPAISAIPGPPDL
jgi:hypothetical protein